jgi:hypothetical protein
MAQQIQIRRDTSTNWSSVNPILAQGEFGLETDSGKLKIGNGTSNWNSLAYFGGAGALASLTDVSISSLASGQVILSNGSSQFLNLSLSSLVNQLVSFSSLGSLAVMNQLSYGSILNTPSLGSLAAMNQLSFTSLLNQPSLGSLAVLNSLTATDVGLGNVTNDAQLKIASNLSDLNNIETARGNLSLGSLAVQNVAVAQLGSTASLDILYANGIVNSSTVSTNFLYANNLFASTISTGVLNAIDGAFASTISTNLIRANNGMFASTVSMQLLRGNAMVIASTASIRTIRGTNASWTGSISATNVSGTNTGDEYNALFGSGEDGDVDFDGSSTTYFYPFSTYSSTVSTYFLTRDIYATTFAVRFGYTLETQGFRIFASESLLNEGVIQNNGKDASGATAGAGATAGFFKAGTNGATGLAAGAAAAEGPAPVLPTANTLLGNFGGRGAAGRASLTLRVGNNAALASAAAPLPAVGGVGLESNIIAYTLPFLPSGAASNLQLTWSMGGGAGAKSALGSGATSGGGGGGGGVIYLASRAVSNNGNINAKGGAGGNAAGTGGTFGGGGGGAGGLVVYTMSKAFADLDPLLIDVSGGAGGTTAGTANTIPLASDNGTYVSNATGQYFTLQPIQPFNRLSYYIVSIHTNYVAGTPGGVNSITGLGMIFAQRQGVDFATIAAPTRSLYVFTGYISETLNADGIDNLRDTLKINLPSPVSSIRVIIDEIQNTSMRDYSDPYLRNATATSDSTANIAVDLGSLPTTNNMIYTVVARAGGTAPAAGTGNVLVNNQTAVPLMASQVAISRASNNQTWTTAAAAGAISIDIGQPTTFEDGCPGTNGKIIRFYG